MQNGDDLINIDIDNIRKSYPSIDVNTLTILVEWINQGMKERKGSWYIFLHPTLNRFADDRKMAFKKAYVTFMNLLDLCPEWITQKWIFENNEAHFVLNEFDLDDVNDRNVVHNPDYPDIVYSNARDLVRTAFVVKPRQNYA